MAPPKKVKERHSPRAESLLTSHNQRARIDRNTVSTAMTSASVLIMSAKINIKLSENVLIKIAEYLPTTDLLSFARVSKDLHYAAVRVLYRTIVDDRDVVGTFCGRVDHLVRTALNNALLACLIKSLSFRTYRAISTNSFIAEGLPQLLKEKEHELTEKLAQPPKIEDPYFTTTESRKYIHVWENPYNRDVLIATLLAYATNLEHLSIDMHPYFKRWTVLPHLLLCYASGVLPTKLEALSIKDTLSDFDMQDVVFSWLAIPSLKEFNSVVLRKPLSKKQFCQFPHLAKLTIHRPRKHRPVTVTASEVSGVLYTLPLLESFSLVSVDLRFDYDTTWSSIQIALSSSAKALRELNIFDIHYKLDSKYSGQALGPLFLFTKLRVARLDASLLFGGMVKERDPISRLNGDLIVLLQVKPIHDAILPSILPPELTKLELRTTSEQNLGDGRYLGALMRFKPAGYLPKWTVFRVCCVDQGIRPCSANCVQFLPWIESQYVNDLRQLGVSTIIG